MAMRLLTRTLSYQGSSSPSSSTIPYERRHRPAAWYYISFRDVLIVVLPLLSFLGAYTTFTLCSFNGTFDWIRAILTQDEPKFPGTDYTLIRKYTSLRPVDRQLSILVAFFAPIVGSKHLPTTLFAIAGFGQFGAAWALMMMEAMRVGNRGRMVSYITVVGILIQNISYTVTTPIWLWLHLLTSPTTESQVARNLNNTLLIPIVDLQVLPVAIVVGYIVPSVMMTLPAPSMISPAHHQYWIALWQAFPVWCVIAQYLLRSAMQSISKDNSQKPLIGTTYLNSVQHVYRFMLTICTITHLPVLLLALVPSSLIPNSWSGLKYAASSNFQEIYIPYIPPSTTYKVSSLVEGVHTFLTWDLYTGSLAILLWAIALWRKADLSTRLPLYRQLLEGERGAQGDASSWKRLAGKIIRWGVFSGPLGIVTVLLWERDEVVRLKVKAGI